MRLVSPWYLRGYLALAAIVSTVVLSVALWAGRIGLMVLIALDLWHLNREVADVVLLLVLAVFRPGSISLKTGE
jgi:uncharacterized membrane protein